MYKAQLTCQKILCFAALMVCGLMFLYSLGMSTDLYDGLFYSLPEESKIEDVKIPGSEIYYLIQPFNRQLLNASIMLLMLACLLFITSTHSRRRYYVVGCVHDPQRGGVNHEETVNKNQTIVRRESRVYWGC